MTRTDVLFEQLRKQYKENEPILLSEIKFASTRQQMKRLTEEGKLKKFDTGIYYIPKASIFRSGSVLSIESVLNKKYLFDNNKRCGYISGLLFANKIGLTTQVPMVYEIKTNKATTEYRETRLGNFRIIVRRPYVTINDENAMVLQFLDLMKDIVNISELEGNDLTKSLLSYLKISGLDFNALKPYLSYYPDRIYKNMFEVGLLNGVFA